MKENSTKSCRARQLVVVAYYDQRPIGPLLELLESMERHEPGCDYDLVVVVSSDDVRPVSPLQGTGVWCLERVSQGMNLGAWDHAWRKAPNYEGYLFLQEECLIVGDQWLEAFVQACGPGTGLVGESMNEYWDLPWDDLRQTRGYIPIVEHAIEGVPANRVDVYLDLMKRNKIDPGDGGKHLRGQVWYAPQAALTDIDGFPIGENYGECIGAEIAVSRLLTSRGWTVTQVSDEPFEYIRHTDWERPKGAEPYEHVNSIGRVGRLRRRVRRRLRRLTNRRSRP